MQHITNLNIITSPELYKSRLEICQKCQECKNFKCKLDESNLLLKAKLTKATCPIDKWDEIESQDPNNFNVFSGKAFLHNEPNKNLLDNSTSVDDIVHLAKTQPSCGWKPDFQKVDNVQEAFRRLSAERSEEIVNGEYPSTKFSGKGIVTCGGGPKYFPSLYVNIRILRMLGCGLPIEVWYLGDDEMDFKSIDLLQEVPGVKCIDETKCGHITPIRPNNTSKKHRGWQSKVYSIINSSFEEVLFLDADNTPLINPEFLFEESEYLNHGAVLWPDFGCWKHDETLWNIMGIPYRSELQVESGQALINKKKCWKEINMAKYYCDYSDYYFKLYFGDKEAFHFGWRFWGSDYGFPPVPKWVNGSIIVQHKFDGGWLFCHRTGSKLQLDKKHKICHSMPHEQDTLELLDELNLRNKNGLWRNETPSEKEKELLKETVGRYKYVREGLDIRDMGIENNNKIGYGSEKMERNWYVFIRDDGNYLTITGDEGPTCLLKQEGIEWVGRWFNHERCVTKLVPYGL